MCYFYCKKEKRNKVLRLAPICSEPLLFRNNVMIWKDFFRKRDKVLNWSRGNASANEITRNEMIDKEKNQKKDGKLNFNAKYCPVFRYLKSQLK